MQFSLTNALITGLHTTVSSFLPQDQVLICGTYALPQLWRFWTTLQAEFATDKFYKANINSMRLRVQELQEAESKAQELTEQKTNSYEEIDKIFHY